MVCIFLASRKFQDYYSRVYSFLQKKREKEGEERNVEQFSGTFSASGIPGTGETKKERSEEYPKTIHFITTVRESFPIHAIHKYPDPASPDVMMHRACSSCVCSSFAKCSRPGPSLARDFLFSPEVKKLQPRRSRRRIEHTGQSKLTAFGCCSKSDLPHRISKELLSLVTHWILTA